MRRIPFVPLKGVDNVELFYDLIFVYLISVITSLLHHPHNGFIDPSVYISYILSFMTVLQIWFFTTLLMNRYGTKSASDYVCLFINMFLLYFMASGISDHWESTIFTFDISWALILVNLLFHWGYKLFRFEGIDSRDRLIIGRTMGALATQLIIVLAAAFSPAYIASWLSLAAVAVGMLLWTQGKVFSLKAPRFAHLTERCALLVIVTFGETIVAISAYMTTTATITYPILVFALVVGLFLIYTYEYDHMLDHHHKSNGMTYMMVHAWIVIVLGNLTLGLEFMTNSEFDFLPKNIFLTVFLVLYLLTSFMLTRYNKPEYHYSYPYVVGRIIVCVLIVVVAIVSSFNPTITLTCDVIAIYLALGHEMFLFRGRNRIIEYVHSRGLSHEELEEQGFTFTTREGRRAIREAMRDTLSTHHIDESDMPDDEDDEK